MCELKLGKCWILIVSVCVMTGEKHRKLSASNRVTEFLPYFIDKKTNISLMSNANTAYKAAQLRFPEVRCSCTN